MATINLGAIKFNWKGAYNSSTTYAVDDVVSSGGNSYVCIQAHSNQAVGNATAYWNIMSSAGTNGTDGSDGTDISNNINNTRRYTLQRWKWITKISCRNFWSIIKNWWFWCKSIMAYTSQVGVLQTVFTTIHTR